MGASPERNHTMMTMSQKLAEARRTGVAASLDPRKIYDRPRLARTLDVKAIYAKLNARAGLLDGADLSFDEIRARETLSEEQVKRAADAIRRERNGDR